MRRLHQPSKSCPVQSAHTSMTRVPCKNESNRGCYFCWNMLEMAKPSNQVQHRGQSPGRQTAFILLDKTSLSQVHWKAHNCTTQKLTSCPHHKRPQLRPAIAKHRQLVHDDVWQSTKPTDGRLASLANGSHFLATLHSTPRRAATPCKYSPIEAPFDASRDAWRFSSFPAALQHFFVSRSKIS